MTPRAPAPPRKAIPRTRAAPKVAAPRALASALRGVPGFLLGLLDHAMVPVALVTVLVHMALGRSAAPLVVRLLVSIPAVLLLIELRSYAKSQVGELPFLLVGLIQYYVSFSFPIFFDLEFYDIDGPVHFSNASQISAGVAIGGGALLLWIASRLGARVGAELQPFATRVFPVETVPEGWDKSVIAYATLAATMGLVTLVFPGIIPPELSLPFLMTINLHLAMGMLLAAPPKPTHWIKPHLPLVLLGVGSSTGLLGGSLDPIFRFSVVYLAGQWSFLRRVSTWIVIVAIAIFGVLQPVKQRYRERVWGETAKTGQAVSYADRLSAWEDSFIAVWLRDEGQRTEKNVTAIERLDELGAVMHAFEVLPGRVQSLDGQGFLYVLYSPIPRFIWRSKPTTQDTVQRYGVAFGRQTTKGALSTAINCPPHVEGYWNFGWPGIAFVCFMIGLYLGFAKALFASSRWALRAVGLALLGMVSSSSATSLVFASLFQSLVGFTLATWAVFGLASLLSKRRPQLHGGRKLRKA